MCDLRSPRGCQLRSKNHGVWLLLNLLTSCLVLVAQRAIQCVREFIIKVSGAQILRRFKLFLVIVINTLSHSK